MAVGGKNSVVSTLVVDGEITARAKNTAAFVKKSTERMSKAAGIKAISGATAERFRKNLLPGSLGKPLLPTTDAMVREGKLAAAKRAKFKDREESLIKENGLFGQLNKKVKQYTGVSRTLDNTTRKLTATNMSFLGVMFGMMGVMNVTSRLMGAIFSPLGNLSGMFETLALSMAFGAAENREMMKNIDPALMVDSWMKYMGVVSDVKLALLDLAVGVFQGPQFEKIQEAVKEFVAFATDSDVQKSVGKLAETMIKMVTVGGKALIKIFEFMTDAEEFTIPILGITTSMEKVSPVILKWSMLLAAASIIILPLLSIVTVVISLFSALSSVLGVFAAVVSVAMTAMGMKRAGGVVGSVADVLRKKSNKCCKLNQGLIPIGKRGPINNIPTTASISGIITRVLTYIPIIAAAVIATAAILVISRAITDRANERMVAKFGADWQLESLTRGSDLTKSRALTEFGDREGSLLGTREVDTRTPADQFINLTTQNIIDTRVVGTSVEAIAIRRALTERIGDNI